MPQALAKVALACLIFCRVPIAPLSAQELRASLIVHVVDATGAVIPGASVVLSPTDGGAETSRSTDTSGEVRFLGLAPATYSVTANARGFAPLTKRVILPIGLEAALPFTRRVGRGLLVAALLVTSPSG